MSNEMQTLLRGAVTTPRSQPDVAAAQRRGRALRARRRLASGVATLAVVAAAVGTVATIASGHHDKTVVASVTEPTQPPAPPVCAAAVVGKADLPAWATATVSLPDVPHLVSANGQAVAFVFGNPLREGHPTDRANKILWLLRGSDAGPPLEVKATLAGGDVRDVHVRVPPAASPAGNYPSIIDVPQAGCWRFELTWGQQRATINLRYVANH